MIKTRHILAGLAIAVFAILPISCSNQLDPSKFMPRYSAVPNFSVIMNNGESVNAFTLISTPAVMITFDTQTSECRKMLPMLQQAYDEYGYKVKFVPISADETKENLENYWKEHGFTLPYSVQTDDEQANKFSSTRPYILVINDDFRTVASWDSKHVPTLQEFEDQLERAIK